MGKLDGFVSDVCRCADCTMDVTQYWGWVKTHQYNLMRSFGVTEKEHREAVKRAHP